MGDREQVNKKRACEGNLTHSTIHLILQYFPLLEHR